MIMDMTAYDLWNNAQLDPSTKISYNLEIIAMLGIAGIVQDPADKRQQWDIVD